MATYSRLSYGDTVYYDRYSYDEDLSESDFEECDVESENIYAHCFMNAQGDHVNFTRLNLEEDELLAKIPLLDGPGRGVSISEATGNEGATKDLWYQRGAVILWPKDRDLDMVKKMDVDYGLFYLKKSLKKKTSLKGKNRPKIVELAHHIMNNLSHYNIDDMVRELILIGDINLLQDYIHIKLINSYDLSSLKSSIFIQIAETFGWQYFKEDVREQLSKKRVGVLDWLKSLLLEKKSLSSNGKDAIKNWFESYWESSLQRTFTVNQLSHVFQILSMLEIHELSDELLDFLSGQKQALFVTEIYAPALVKTLKVLKQNKYDSTILSKFVKYVRQKLKRDFPAPPEKPQDLSREGALNCACEFCAQVNQFLPNPIQREFRFDKTLKRNLIHVEAEIKKSQVDLDIIITKSPPKFYGTCIKNQNRFDYQLNLFNQAQKTLKELQLTN